MIDANYIIWFITPHSTVAFVISTAVAIVVYNLLNRKQKKSTIVERVVGKSHLADAVERKIVASWLQLLVPASFGSNPHSHNKEIVK